jgi:hypothetical protein
MDGGRVPNYDLTLKKLKGTPSSYKTEDGRWYVVRQEDGYWCWGENTSNGSEAHGDTWYRKYEAVEQLQAHLEDLRKEQELWES